MSSVNSLSSASSLYGSQSSSSNPQQLFQRLQSALQSGDLESAQNAFGALQRATSGKTPPGGSDGAVAKAMTSLSNALSSGDLSSAQSAFSNLQSALKSMGPPPGLASGGTSGSDTSTDSSMAHFEEQLLQALEKNTSSGSSSSSNTNSLTYSYTDASSSVQQ